MKDRRLGYPVVCLTYNKLYDNIQYASKLTRTDARNISKCCLGEMDYTVNSEKTKLHWMFAKDYESVYGTEKLWELHRATQDFYTNDNEEY